MQLDFFDVPSPCINICESDEKGNCRGCMRTREERQSWKAFTNDEKQKVIKRCVQRQRRKEKQQKSSPVIATVQPAKDILQPSLLDPPSRSSSISNSDIDFSEFEL